MVDIYDAENEMHIPNWSAYLTNRARQQLAQWSHSDLAASRLTSYTQTIFWWWGYYLSERNIPRVSRSDGQILVVCVAPYAVGVEV